VVAVRCSIGTVNAAACASVLVQRFGAQVIINTGIAGSLCRELSMLDIVIADDLIFHDADLDIMEKYYPFRRSFPTDPVLRELARQAIHSLDAPPRYKVGRIASGDVFVSDEALKDSIARRCDPLCVEMEGAAIAQVAFMGGIPCLVIRALSDNADENAEESYDNLIELAADNSARILLAMLSLAEE